MSTGSIIDSDLYLDIQRGRVPGMSLVHKFGSSNIGTTLAPVTDSGFYRTPTTPTSLEFVSSSANDNSTGSGAREVVIMGLGSDWKEIYQTVITNGTTAVALKHKLRRLYRWYVTQSGTYATQSAGSHDGTLTIQEVSGGQTWSTIGVTPFANGQSEIGVYSIPKGKTGYVLSAFLQVDSTKSIDAYFFQRSNADDIVGSYSGVMRLMFKAIGVTGDVSFSPRSPMTGVAGPADIGFMAQVASSTGDISVDFEVLLIDNLPADDV